MLSLCSASVRACSLITSSYSSPTNRWLWKSFQSRYVTEKLSEGFDLAVCETNVSVGSRTPNGANRLSKGERGLVLNAKFPSEQHGKRCR